MKKKVFIIVLTVIIVLIQPITLVFVGFCMPSQFGDTYYGELAYMFDKLNGTEGKKIILIGNSSVAFGVRSDLLQAEFPEYTVVNFGLYSSLGTKLMLDLSKANIGKGDIIIVMPEPYAQSSSLYFSAKDTWRAVDGDFSMLRYIANENKSAMAGAFVGYTSEKFKFLTSETAMATNGVYSRQAFVTEDGESADYIVYDRPYNVMAGGYDATFTIESNEDIFGDGFFEYLNEYNRYAVTLGAKVYYGFCPVNSLALRQETASKFYAYLSSRLDLDIIGQPTKYCLDYHWFYDNNVHLNSAGMYIFTDLLAEDLKFQLKINTPNQIPLPEFPEIPVNAVLTGDNSDAQMFTYEQVSGATGEFIRLTGLTEEGKKKTELTLPTDYDGVPVYEFSSSLFKGNVNIGRIVLSENIRTIYDNSFEGAIRLSELIFRHDSVLGLNVGVDFLYGADNCIIYVKQGVNVTNCVGGWERYQSRIKYYK